MSEMIRVSGKTLEDAITNATISLGVTSDSIVYTIIEHESKGFLGIGAKDAVIEVRVKNEADYEAEKLKIKAEEDAARTAQEAADKAAAEEENAAQAAAEEMISMETEETAYVSEETASGTAQAVETAEEFAEEKFMLFKNNFVINPVAVKKMIEKTATKGSILKMRFI